MTPRERLRGRLGIKEETGPHAPKVNDEELLNVLRREKEKADGEDELTTKEIADRLPIVRKTVSERLKKLEGKRVTKRRAGSTDMWSLSDGEPETVINPEMGSVVEYSSKARRRAVDVKKKGRFFAEIGFVFLIIGMTIWISDIQIPDHSVAVFLALGYSFGLVGGSIIGASAVLRLFGLMLPQLFEYLLID